MIDQIQKKVWLSWKEKIVQYLGILLPLVVAFQCLSLFTHCNINRKSSDDVLHQQKYDYSKSSEKSNISLKLGLIKKSEKDMKEKKNIVEEISDNLDLKVWKIINR